MGRSAGSSGVGSHVHVGDGQDETVENGSGGRSRLGEGDDEAEAHGCEEEKNRRDVAADDRADRNLCFDTDVKNGEAEEHEDEENVKKAGPENRNPEEAAGNRRAGTDIL